MTFGMPELLLFVFVTHLPFFAWKYHRTREARFAATTCTFALLVVAYGIRVFAPELTWRDRSLFQVTRVVAWISAAFSIGLLLRHQLSRALAPR